MLTDPETKVNDTIVDIDLSPIRKKKFRIDGDDNRILELNVSDLGIFSRFQEAYPKLDELATKAVFELPDSSTVPEGEDVQQVYNKKLKQIDEEMRESLDYIFDSNVSEMCAPFGSMFDPIGGKLRFEYILDVMSNLYENNFNAEVKQMSQRMKKHTAKYTKKKTKK